ncbi:hypothetical protein AKUH4B505J_04800 [Apilactobacillus kunkeei]|nr:hypothetical protein AKUH4B505J_04800 [Apilactobacillus kunkeei]
MINEEQVQAQLKGGLQGKMSEVDEAYDKLTQSMNSVELCANFLETLQLVFDEQSDSSDAMDKITFLIKKNNSLENFIYNLQDAIRSMDKGVYLLNDYLSELKYSIPVKDEK